MSLDEVATTLLTIVQNYYGGMLLIEDINKYISDHAPNDLIEQYALIGIVMLILLFIIKASVEFRQKYGNLDYIRFHKIKESIGRHQNKFEDKAECLMLAETLLTINMK